MPTFDVEICRTSYQFARVRVQAKNRDEAEKAARLVEGDQSYSEKDADYSTSGVYEVSK
jgi:hypothetical protein